MMDWIIFMGIMFVLIALILIEEKMGKAVEHLGNVSNFLKVIIHLLETIDQREEEK